MILIIIPEHGAIKTFEKPLQNSQRLTFNTGDVEIYVIGVSDPHDECTIETFFQET